MLSYIFSEIALVVSGKLEGKSEGTIHSVFTDSRSPVKSDQSLFIALKGERHNGHRFISELFELGVRHFLVSEPPEASLVSRGGNFILVEDTMQALQTLAGYHRTHHQAKVVGITGSNGKTIVKEWLAYLIDNDRQIVRSPKSYNSQVGVPLSVLLLESDSELGIFEAGISRPGEMERIEKVLQPDIGLFTNLGEAHQENFSSHEQKLREKLVLFRNVRTLVYCSDNEFNDHIIRETFAHTDTRLVCWSRKPGAELEIIATGKKSAHTTISGIFQGEQVEITIPFSDEASVENAVHCWLLMLQMNLYTQEVHGRFRTLPVVAMRLELKKGINSCTLINDSYNSDFVSLIVALDFLLQQNQNPNKTLILSDILQSGKPEEQLYREVANLVRSKGISRFIGIGPSLSRYASLFPSSECYGSTEEFMQRFSGSRFINEAILFKGARKFMFERVVDALELKTHATRLEINLNAMVDNLNYYRSLLKPGTRMMAMVKALSYGSGTFEIANMLQFHKIDYLTVAYADEGVELRRAGIRLPIMVMNPEARSFETIADFDLEPEIYSRGILEQFIHFLALRGARDFPVHIKLDTGMHRLGFEEEEMESLHTMLNASGRLRVRSVFSHLVASEDPAEDAFTNLQIERFERMTGILRQSLPYPFLRHILNSAGIERFPDAQFDMVRLGIGLYGISTSSHARLRQIGTLKSLISQIHRVKQGDTVGYNRTFKAEKETLVATVPIGYADGLDRRLGKGASGFLVHGQQAPTVGNICMDMCMIDITGIDAKEGDEVIIFGDGLPVNDLARKLNTIPYEILTSVSGRVNRVYYQE